MDTQDLVDTLNALRSGSNKWEIRKSFNDSLINDEINKSLEEPLDRNVCDRLNRQIREELNKKSKTPSRQGLTVMMTKLTEDDKNLLATILYEAQYINRLSISLASIESNNDLLNIIESSRLISDKLSKFIDSHK